MKRWVLSERARADLGDVWRYSAEHWSEAQAERYLRQIRRAIEAIAQTPGLGARCDEIRQGYRRIRVGSRVLFYREAGRIEVIRVLHAAMDFGRHL